MIINGGLIELLVRNNLCPVCNSRMDIDNLGDDDCPKFYADCKCGFSMRVI